MTKRKSINKNEIKEKEIKKNLEWKFKIKRRKKLNKRWKFKR